MDGPVFFKRHFIVTGGAGFIGSHMVDFLLENYPESIVTCLDKLSYASDYLLENLEKAQKYPNFRFVKLDLAEDVIAIQEILLRDCELFDAVTIFHFAAESCVDHSFMEPLFFTKNNILATQNLLEAVRMANKHDHSKFDIIQISTDEVYGEQSLSGCVNERSCLEPSNPYAATKAACDLITGAYVKSYNLKISTIRANNVYGPRQHSEKLIAATLHHLQYANLGVGLDSNELITIHGNGQHRRRYLHVSDFVRGVDIVERNARSTGNFGETYNIGTEDEWKNIDMVQMICRVYMWIIFLEKVHDFTNFYRLGKDRLYNDSRYSMNTGKISQLGWRPEISLEEGITKMILKMREK